MFSSKKNVRVEKIASHAENGEKKFSPPQL
jgi:hypothetical protein